jgi:tetratricopeptide (TPR) repeat protein
VNLDELYQRAAALERDGRWAEAEAAYRDLFDKELTANGNAPRAADALRHQAVACRRQNRFEEAEELATLSWKVAELCGYVEGAARAVNGLAATYYWQGDLARAKHLYKTAQTLGLDAGDDEVIGFSCQNLSVIEFFTGDLREARSLCLEAIASAVRSGSTRTTAGVYNNLGLICTDLREWMEAELYFDRGIEIAAENEDRALLAILHTNRARPLTKVGDFSPARASLAAAEAVAAHIGDRGTLAEIEVGRATIARLQGDFAAADAHLSRALSLSAEGGLERENALAIEALRRASEIFRSLSSVRDTARVDARLTEWTVSVPLTTAGSAG